MELDRNKYRYILKVKTLFNISSTVKGFKGGLIFLFQLTKLHQLALQHAPLLPGHSVGTLSPQGKN